MRTTYTKWIAIFMTVTVLLLSISACGSDDQSPASNHSSSSGRSYLGDWVVFPDESSAYNNLNITITENEIVSIDDGIRIGMEYTVSSDEYYTYLECTVEGTTVVFVVINEDMLAICGNDYEYSDFVGTTPNGVKFNANIRENVLFKSGAPTTAVPESLRSSKYFSADDTLYYYENADVIFPVDSTGHSDGIFAVTTAYEIEYAEAITLVNMNASGNTWIPTNGNFVIIDNK